MNKGILYFIAGAGLGAGGMYIGLKSHFDKLLNTETDKVKEYYNQKLEDYIAANEQVSPTEPNEAKAEPKKAKTAAGSGTKKKTTTTKKKEQPEEEGPKVDYAKISATPKKVRKAKLNDIPYVITEEEYGGNHKYAERRLTYFAEDEVLIDTDTDEVIDDPNKTVGNANLMELVDYTDLSEICVRNELLAEDYMITLDNGSYEDYVSGSY